MTLVVDVAHHHRARRVRSPWLSGGGLWSDKCIRTVLRSKPDDESAGNLHRGKQVSPVCPTYQAGSGCSIHEMGSGCPVVSTLGTALGTKRPGHLDAAMLERPPCTKAGGSPMLERLGKALRERVWATLVRLALCPLGFHQPGGFRWRTAAVIVQLEVSRWGARDILAVTSPRTPGAGCCNPQDGLVVSRQVPPMPPRLRLTTPRDAWAGLCSGVLTPTFLDAARRRQARDVSALSRPRSLARDVPAPSRTSLPQRPRPGHRNVGAPWGSPARVSSSGQLLEIRKANR